MTAQHSSDSSAKFWLVRRNPASLNNGDNPLRSSLKKTLASSIRGWSFLPHRCHGGAEEEFEVVGSGGVFGDGGLDGLLRDGAWIAEVDERGERVVAGGP